MRNIIFLKCNIWKRLLLKYREIVIYLEKQILLRKIENADTFDPVHWHSITQNLSNGSYLSAIDYVRTIKNIDLFIKFSERVKVSTNAVPRNCKRASTSLTPS